MIRYRGFLFAIRTRRIREYLRWVATGHISAEAERIAADIPRLIAEIRQHGVTRGGDHAEP
jgi:hypothetical protein